MTTAKFAGALCLAGCFLALATSPALAGTADIFGSTSPLQKFRDFVTGPFAVTIVIVGIVVVGSLLMFGNDLSGFGRRALLVVLGGGFVLGATAVVSNLFGSTQGAVYSIEQPLLLDAENSHDPQSD